MTVCQTSDESGGTRPERGQCYKAPRFDSKTNKIGPSTHQPLTARFTEEQVRVWSSFFPPYTINPSLSRASSTRRRYRHGQLGDGRPGQSAVSATWVLEGQRRRPANHTTSLHTMSKPAQTISTKSLRVSSTPFEKERFFSYKIASREPTRVQKHGRVVAKPPEGDTPHCQPEADNWGGGPLAPSPATHHIGGWWWCATHHTGGWPEATRGGGYA